MVWNQSWFGKLTAGHEGGGVGFNTVFLQRCLIIHLRCFLIQISYSNVSEWVGAICKGVSDWAQWPNPKGLHRVQISPTPEIVLPFISTAHSVFHSVSGPEEAVYRVCLRVQEGLHPSLLLELESCAQVLALVFPTSCTASWGAQAVGFPSGLLCLSPLQGTFTSCLQGHDEKFEAKIKGYTESENRDANSEALLSTLTVWENTGHGALIMPSCRPVALMLVTDSNYALKHTSWFLTCQTLAQRGQWKQHCGWNLSGSRFPCPSLSSSGFLLSLELQISCHLL